MVNNVILDDELRKKLNSVFDLRYAVVHKNVVFYETKTYIEAQKFMLSMPSSLRNHVKIVSVLQFVKDE